MKARACELCNQEASLYCASDAAFLCWNCDATVHHANFLVARHLRHLLCCKCNRFAGNPISGAIPLPITSTCSSCSFSPENPSEDGDSLSSGCVSSSESCAAAPKKIKVRGVEGEGMEEVFVKWRGELGVKKVNGSIALRLGKWRALPFRLRVAAATSFWFELRFYGGRSVATLQNLRRLEAMSGLPAKVILGAEPQPVLRHTLHAQLPLMEGWAESHS